MCVVGVCGERGVGCLVGVCVGRGLGGMGSECVWGEGCVVCVCSGCEGGGGCCCSGNCLMSTQNPVCRGERLVFRNSGRVKHCIDRIPMSP